MSNKLNIGGKPRSVSAKLGSNMQRAEGRSMGANQATRVPTHEGSQLSSHSLAKASESSMPADKQSQ